METQFIEATHGPDAGNWGKFMVQAFSPRDWTLRSVVDDTLLIPGRGWTGQHVLVHDLQTGEGAIFRVGPNASASNDLRKHAIWVCPLFEPFLHWLYQQNLGAVWELPRLVELPDAPFALQGHRRRGPAPEPFRIVGYDLLPENAPAADDPASNERGFVLYPLDQSPTAATPTGPIASSRDWLQYGTGPIILVAVGEGQSTAGMLFHAPSYNLLSLQQVSQVERALVTAREIAEALTQNRALTVENVLEGVERTFGIRLLNQRDVSLHKTQSK